MGPFFCPTQLLPWRSTVIDSVFDVNDLPRRRLSMSWMGELVAGLRKNDGRDLNRCGGRPEQALVAELTGDAFVSLSVRGQHVYKGAGSMESAPLPLIRLILCRPSSRETFH